MIWMRGWSCLGVIIPTASSQGTPPKMPPKAILETRGNTPRLYRNTLVFLAADKTRLQDLEEAARRYLAWDSILAEKETLNLDPHQVKQAETQQKSADGAVTARIPEAYQWLLVPVQSSPKARSSGRASGSRARTPWRYVPARKLRNDELLVTALAGTRLRMELDRVPLWRGNHVAIKQLVEDFARYLYLPRLTEPNVLTGAIRDGLGLLLWNQESFAYADSFDEKAGRYRGLRCGQTVLIASGDTGLLVRPEVASQQQEAEVQAASPGVLGNMGRTSTPTTTERSGCNWKEWQWKPKSAPAPKRFHGSVTLDPTRVGRDAGRIADEVISHLVGLVGSDVTVTLEIEAEIPTGAPDNVVRTVTENSRTLKFTTQGFENE